jgi:hypothetical protein
MDFTIGLELQTTHPHRGDNVTAAATNSAPALTLGSGMSCQRLDMSYAPPGAALRITLSPAARVRARLLRAALATTSVGPPVTLVTPGRHLPFRKASIHHGGSGV